MLARAAARSQNSLFGIGGRIKQKSMHWDYLFLLQIIIFNLKTSFLL